METAAPVESGKTWTVVNHNTQEKETLRNNDSTLELVGADGKSLWSIEIEGRVLGDVVQIDALKNNKLQMAFTTESAVYILDRNGTPLPGFPYHTKPPITSPLLVADYDNTKKYRLIFAAGDGMLFNFGVDGNPTSGWKFSNTASEKIIALKTQKIGSDDVILTVTDQGNIQLLKRTGETKVTCKTKLEGFDGKTLDIVAGNDFSTTSLVYSCGSSAKTVQLSVE
jgi:outer membrane protein assembly factor BamB